MGGNTVGDVFVLRLRGGGGGEHSGGVFKR